MCFNNFKKSMVSLKVFTVVSLFSILFLGTTVYAAVPYTYAISTVTVNAATTTTTKNTLDITFDYAIKSVNTAKITIDQTSGSTAMRVPTIGTPVIDTADKKILHISIGDLDPAVMDYEIIIEKDALDFGTAYTPLTNFIVPFSSLDLANGFKSVFMNNTAANLNANIFTLNSPRDISIYVPKKYVTSIETIHKKQGLTTDTTSTYPKLTNIDVKTDSTVKRLKVSVTPSAGIKMVDKEIFPSSSMAGFTTGDAGLNIDTGSDYTITIKAFDINGRILENTSYKEKVQNLELVNDYITSKTSTSSNKTITLYDLMKTPATLTSILTAYTTNLDSIKVVYPNTNDTRIISNSDGQTNDASNVLAKALSDDSVQYIKFEAPLTIAPGQVVALARTSVAGKPKRVVLDGNGSTITGDVLIGYGSNDNNIYELRNMTIIGNLTVDVSTTGDCILSGVDIKNGYKIVKNKKNPEVTEVVAMDDKTLYGIGQVIKIGVKFSEPVFVVGKPVLKLSGTNATTNTNVSIGNAIYDGILSTVDELVFNYEVKEGDNFLNIKSTGIDFSNGDIQATEGASHIQANAAGAEANIYSITGKKDIAVDGIRPFLSKTVSNPIQVDGTKITYIANETLDRTTAEIADNWKIRVLDNTEAGFTDYKPLKVFLQGDNETVIIEMPNTIIVPISTDDITNKNASVFMTNIVNDKAGNPANDMVTKADGSLGVAWHEGIVGLPKDHNYKVSVGTDIPNIQYVIAGGTLSSVIGNLAPLSDTKITGLVNGETYKVIPVVGTVDHEKDTANVAADKALLTDAIILSGNNVDVGNVKNNLNLPTTNGTNGSIITWSSTDTNVIKDDGTVIRPSNSLTNPTVTVTATIANGTAIDTKVFDITVLKKDFKVKKSIFADNNFTIEGDGYLLTDFIVSRGVIEFTGGTTVNTWVIGGLTYSLSYTNTTGIAKVTVTGTATVASDVITKDITVTKDGQIKTLTLSIPAIVKSSTGDQVAVTITAN